MKLKVLWFFPYFMEHHITSSLPDFKMLDFKVDYENHSSFTDVGNRKRKHGSPVRIFTNVPLQQFDLSNIPDYKFCEDCNFWVSRENSHCFQCKACTSKNGTTYWHCEKCRKCVKPSYEHCDACSRCCLKSHVCGEFQPDLNCYHCHKSSHKKYDCPELKKRKLEANFAKSKRKKKALYVSHLDFRKFYRVGIKRCKIMASENEEKMEVPDNFEFSEKNFVNRFTPNDDMPLMPSYSTYSARLASFNAIKDSCPQEEIVELAKTGLYLSDEQRLSRETSESEFEERHIAFCFCCGCENIVCLKYPRLVPVTHYLHCKFFTLPEDKEFIKGLIKPFRGVEDVDFDYLERVRAELYPDRVINAPRSAPLCKVCRLNELEVLCWPCSHQCCISCAKSKTVCPECGQAYKALERYYPF